jgi:hypothetical protein
MSVLVTAEVPNQTAEGYDAVRTALEGVMRAAPGFILHTAHPTGGGWRVLEIWDSAKAANDFFAKYVHPNLPPGVKPRRSFQELHGVIRP